MSNPKDHLPTGWRRKGDRSGRRSQGSAPTIQEIVMQMRQRQEAARMNRNVFTPPFDPFANAEEFKTRVRGRTGLGYDEFASQHKCPWDEAHPENMHRFLEPLKRIIELGLDKRCLVFKVPEVRIDFMDNILKVHTKEHVQKLLKISQQTDETEREKSCSQYDSVYMNESTYESANRALATVLNLCDAIKDEKIQNGLALIRPPGHHAGAQDFNGYCFLNNVAVATEYVIEKKIARKILIIDVDVHHGQGIQRKFYERDDVLYFSIHRYDYGDFWPNLIESDFHATGKGKGRGYNINVPLNATCLKDDDFIAIIIFLLLPVAYEFNPDLIIIAAGFDASVGCPEGRMLVSPSFYSHMIKLLNGLAEGRILVVLEGGYFIPSLTEGITMTLKALLDDPCPKLDPIKGVDPAVVEVINNVRAVHSHNWMFFKHTVHFCDTQHPEDHVVKVRFQGDAQPQSPFPTRHCYPLLNEEDQRHFETLLAGMHEEYQREQPTKIGCMYNPNVLNHRPTNPELQSVKETPDRLIRIMQMYETWGMKQRVVDVKWQCHDVKRYSHHDPEYIKSLMEKKIEEKSDLYYNQFTTTCCDISISGLCTLADEIMYNRTILRGIGVVRPPGHHAETGQAMGHCFMNNVVVLANYLVKHHTVHRIAIIDFDIHHGNGTQNATYTNPNILYISVHRFDQATFFPKHLSGDVNYCGYGAGEGYNINIPFSGGKKMGDSEYMAVFLNVILPALYAYGPDFLIVSAGFDGGIHDPLGNYNLTPEVFGHFMHLLRPFAGGKMIMVLEGGYNLVTLAYSFNMCVKALLGDPIPKLPDLFENFCYDAVKTVRSVTDFFKKYYPIFNCLKTIVPRAVIFNRINDTVTWQDYNEMCANREVPIHELESQDFQDIFGDYSDVSTDE